MWSISISNGCLAFELAYLQKILIFPPSISGEKIKVNIIVKKLLKRNHNKVIILYKKSKTQYHLSRFTSNECLAKRKRFHLIFWIKCVQIILWIEKKVNFTCMIQKEQSIDVFETGFKTRLWCFDVTAIFSWSWLRLKWTSFYLDKLIWGLIWLFSWDV